MFYNYKFPAQPDPVAASLMPNYVTSAPNISYAEGSNDAVGIQLLAKANTTFAIRFSGAYSSVAPDLGSELRVSTAPAIPGSAGAIGASGADQCHTSTVHRGKMRRQVLVSEGIVTVPIHHAVLMASALAVFRCGSRLLPGRVKPVSSAVAQQLITRARSSRCQWPLMLHGEQGN